jgi:hypothetical protein
LEAATPKRTRLTSTQWKIRKLGALKYEIYNDAQTEDGKHAIVRLLEEGTKPHKILPKNKKALRWEVGATPHFAKVVLHPGFEGRRFIERTLNRSDLKARFEKFIRVKLKQNLKL